MMCGIVTDSFFEAYGGGDSWPSEKKRINFTPFSLVIRQELKYFFAIQLINGALTLKTLVFYSATFTSLSAFLHKHYSEIYSFIEIPYEKGLMKYKTFLYKSYLYFRHHHMMFQTSNKLLWLTCK